MKKRILANGAIVARAGAPTVAIASLPDPVEEKWLKAKEILDVICHIIEAIKPLTQAQRERVIGYIWRKYVNNPGPKEGS